MKRGRSFYWPWWPNLFDSGTIFCIANLFIIVFNQNKSTPHLTYPSIKLNQNNFWKNSNYNGQRFVNTNIHPDRNLFLVGKGCFIAFHWLPVTIFNSQILWRFFFAAGDNAHYPTGCKPNASEPTLCYKVLINNPKKKLILFRFGGSMAWPFDAILSALHLNT